MSQHFSGNGSLLDIAEVQHLIREFHYKSIDLGDEEIDAALGLGIVTVENKLDFLDLVLHYGQHKLYQGDLDYQLIRELYTRLETFVKLSDFSISHILDLGSGYGRLVFYGILLWSNINFCGIEIVLERVLEARKISQSLNLEPVDFICCDVVHAPWPFANCFLIMNSFTSEVLSKVLSRLERLSKQQDFIIVSVWSCNDYIGRQKWLQEVVMHDFLNEKLSIKIFQTAS